MMAAAPQGKKKWLRIWFISCLKGQIVFERQGEGHDDGDGDAFVRRNDYRDKCQRKLN
jgi:hypothetical protein